MVGDDDGVKAAGLGGGLYVGHRPGAIRAGGVHMSVVVDEGELRFCRGPFKGGHELIGDYRVAAVASVAAVRVDVP